MYCTGCGSKLAEGALYCAECGTKVPVLETDEKPTVSNEPETASVQEPVDFEIQQFRDRLTENASGCNKIKKIEVKNPPNRYGINSSWLHIKIKGCFLKYLYLWNSETEEIKRVSCMWTGGSFFMFLFASLCDCFFLEFYFEQEYFLILTLCTMALSIIWFYCSICADKEAGEIEDYMGGMLHCKFKHRAVFTIIQYILNIIGIGLCISALVMGFEDSRMVPEKVSGDGSLITQGHVSAGQIDESEDEDTELSLNQVYSDEDEGFSFMYPDGWTVDEGYSDGLVMVFSPNESMFTGSAANIIIAKDYADEAYFAATVSDFEEILPIWLGDGAEDICVLALEDVSLSGCPARKLVYTFMFDGDSKKQIFYFYSINSDIYFICCTSRGDLLDKYEPIFDKVMDSYTITASFETSFLDRESFIYAPTGRVEGAYHIGDTASMSMTYPSGKVGYYDITMTDWGTYIPQYSSKIYVYVTFEVVNSGDEDIHISENSFNAYVNNYNADTMYFEDALSATLSPGRQTSGNVYIEMDPNDINNLELELGDIIFRIQDYSVQDMDGLSDFSYDELYLFGGSYEGSNDTSIWVAIYSSFDEGDVVGNVSLYDSLGHETFAAIRDDKGGEGIYTLCLDDSSIMYIRFYQDNIGEYHADIQGLDTIYTNAGQIESYIMTEQYIP